MCNKFLPTFLFTLFISSFANAQTRDAGRLVVPRGYEQYDSIRFGIMNLGGCRQSVNGWNEPATDSTANALTNAWADSIQSTYEMQLWGIPTGAIVAGKRKGVMSEIDTESPLPFTEVARELKARVFHALPQPLNFHFAKGNFWRYNDVAFNDSASVHNNSYDANDISPYCEYPQRDSFVRATFRTYLYSSSTDTTDSLVYYGNEGRVILGASDDKRADELLHACINRYFPRYISGSPVYDTAHTFSLTLDFNIDIDNIDTSESQARPDSTLPLLKFQVLFKKGSDATDPWPIMPFVPFKDATHPKNAGWYKLAEVTVDKATYRALDTCWKREDVLENGQPSHPWRFKQLHVQLSSLPKYVKSLIRPEDWDHWGQGNHDTVIATFSNPDSLIALESRSYSTNDHLIEIRVLSTYRATVRVRGVDWHDTIVDKFLYRKLAGDSTHSCNPNGQIGGYDDTVHARLAQTFPHQPLPLEFLFNDANTVLESSSNGPLSIPMMGYLDYMGSKASIYCHWREQDNGTNTLHYRRNRLIFDGKPPSITENQRSVFGGQYWNGSTVEFGILPRDYMAHAACDASTVAWPSTNDSLVGLRVTRSAGSDSLLSYRYYTSLIAGLDYLHDLRATSRVALHHPNQRRFAVEHAQVTGGFLHGAAYTIDSSNPSLWAIGHFDHRFGHLNTRPTTPEEIMAQGFTDLANGISSFCNPNGFDFPSNAGVTVHDILRADPGIYTSEMRFAGNWWSALPIQMVHDRNVGHIYTALGPTDYFWFDWSKTRSVQMKRWTNPDTSDICGDLPPFYLGYSNTYRALTRMLGRINSIYDSSVASARRVPHPLKYLKWLDAYSNHNATYTRPNGHYLDDSLTKQRSFLKVVHTQSVEHWTRDSHGNYLDRAEYDADSSAYVEVGLFHDSISSSVKNFAALVVNTRLYPTLNDPEDSIYYNEGLTHELDRSRSLLGDIDVRKVHMKLDYAKWPSSFQSTYYVVRDLWHSDSTWLVHRDSTFAIYLKPGDAKFLYFEKGIAIDVAHRTGSDSGMSARPEFGFNNGRRAIERHGGKRDLLCYTRGHHLYVSYPSVGAVIPGYPERSAGDNIATGYEELLDSTHYYARPSIAVGQDDRSAALVTWYTSSGSTDTGHLVVYYQRDTGYAWQQAADLTTLPTDTSADHHMVTPVITPVDDSTWAVFCGDHGSGGGIRAYSFRTPAVGSPSLTDLGIVVKDSTFGFALFPSVASRPNVSFYPVHLVWQQDSVAGVHHIYYTRFTHFDPTDVPLRDLSVVNISKPLGSCDNLHPSIAWNGTHQNIWGIPKSGGILPPGSISAPAWSFSGSPVKTVDYMDDNVTWEARIEDPKLNTGSNYWPIIRARHEKSPGGLGVGPASWGGFDVFKLDTLPREDYHYPNITAHEREYDSKFAYGINGYGGGWHEWIRMAYQDRGNTIKFASWAPNWQMTSLAETGNLPSLPQTTDDLSHYTDSSMVPRSIGFLSNKSAYKGYSYVRVTNGWFPYINVNQLKPTFHAFVKADSLEAICTRKNISVQLDRGWLLPSNPGRRTTDLLWSQQDPAADGVEDDWASPPRTPNELHSNLFEVDQCDSIIIPRATYNREIAYVQSGLTTSDTLLFRVTLRHWSDSSYLGTVDSLNITQTTAYWPGVTPGLDTSTIRYEVNCSSALDTAFLMVEFLRADTLDNLRRAYIELLSSDSVLPDPEFKRTSHSATPSNALALTVIPNPFNPTAQVDAKVRKTSETRVEVYDMLGKQVLSLYDGIPESETLNLTLDSKYLASGSYVVRVVTGGQVLSCKIQVVK